MALFFQREILQAAAGAAPEPSGGDTGRETVRGGCAATRGAFPVLLLSGDVAQVDGKNVIVLKCQTVVFNVAKQWTISGGRRMRVAEGLPSLWTPAFVEGGR